jgi:molybdate transport system regulatory protein
VAARDVLSRTINGMAKPFLRIYFGDSWIGPGKVQLLEAIRTHGSISAAARAIDMSYRRAWLLIDAMNQMFREPAVTTTLGGRGGGTAGVTPFGDEIITRYRAMEAVTARAIARHVAALERHAKTRSARRKRR